MNTSVTVSLANGRRVAFEVDQHGTGPAYFVLSVRKCGSSMLNIMCRFLASMNKRNLVLAGKFFDENVRENVWSPDPAICDLLYPGNVYADFRIMPTAFLPHPIFREGRRILLVRDPRDALVSEYFSVAYSHPVPARAGSDSPLTDLLERDRKSALASGIDEIVVKRAPWMRSAFLSYADVSRWDGTVVVKYEDYIFRKRELIALITQHFGWTVNSSEVDLILDKIDKRPQVEDPAAFIRQVTPGDHRNKLHPDTIAKLNEEFKKVMDVFGYRAD